jgi:hypothetical protein
LFALYDLGCSHLLLAKQRSADTPFLARLVEQAIDRPDRDAWQGFSLAGKPHALADGDKALPKSGHRPFRQTPIVRAEARCCLPRFQIARLARVENGAGFEIVQLAQHDLCQPLGRASAAA